MSALLQHPSSHALGMAQGWRASVLCAAIGVVAAVIAVYHETFGTMAAVWASSETFMHGFIIAPVSCLLVWAQRKELAAMRPQPALAALPLLAALGMAWLLSMLSDVNVTRQYAAVAMIPASLWVVLGTRIAGRIAFPLAFLLLAVPFGDAFIPALIDITADGTVHALRVTGIPVYREGNSFTIPSGTWSVVEACSGLRYLIASVTLGSLYAHLTYRRWARKAAFIALSAIVPIAANSIRAYLIVMIGHLSGMKLAVGIDHLIYGWIFFGIVMLLLFWVGSLWCDDWRPLPAQPSSAEDRSERLMKPAVMAALACVAVILVWPVWARYALTAPARPHASVPVLSERAGDWQRSSAAFPWKPVYAGGPSITQYTYRNAGQEVSLHIAYYPAQSPNADLVAHGNLFAGPAGKRWHGIEERALTAEAAGKSLALRQAVLFGADARFLVWRWYVMDGATMASPYAVKLRLALDRLLGRPTAGAEILLAAPFHEQEDEARIVLHDFLQSSLPAIQQGVDDAWRK